MNIREGGGGGVKYVCTVFARLGNGEYERRATECIYMSVCV